MNLRNNHKRKYSHPPPDDEDDDTEWIDDDDVVQPKKRKPETQNIIIVLPSGKDKKYYGDGDSDDDDHDDGDDDADDEYEENDTDDTDDEDKQLAKDDKTRGDGIISLKEEQKFMKDLVDMSSMTISLDSITLDKNDKETKEVAEEYLELVKERTTLDKKLKKKPNNRLTMSKIKQCNQNITYLITHQKESTADRYMKQLNKMEKKENEYKYFRNHLSHKEQLSIVKELRNINKKTIITKPFRISLLEYTSVPIEYKSIVLQKLNILESMKQDHSEYYKLSNWINTFMKIPFNKLKGIDVRLEDGLEKTNDFIVGSKRQLDNCVYGMNEPKEQIIQLLAQWITNPNIVGTAIGIGGPAGTGKTTLVREGISKIMCREFVFIALGGMTDASFLEGHSYTYEGSTWGKIIQSLIECKSMNPVIFFDELDKVSESSKGQEIINILIHLTDTSQNNEFRDKYFCDIALDLSKCLFIFSYNDETRISPILRDRMYSIKTRGYNVKEKTIISKGYLIPRMLSEMKFNDADIVISDGDINHIINKYCNRDEGVRNLKRCLETIYKKINTYRLVKEGSDIFTHKMSVVLPMVLNTKIIDTLLVDFIKEDKSYLDSMYV